MQSSNAIHSLGKESDRKEKTEKRYVVDMNLSDPKIYKQD